MPLRWHREMGIHVHERGEAINTVPTLADGSIIETTDGACFGSVATTDNPRTLRANPLG